MTASVRALSELFGALTGRAKQLSGRTKWLSERSLGAPNGSVGAQGGSIIVYVSEPVVGVIFLGGAGW